MAAPASPLIAVTGATGKLGHAAVLALLDLVPPQHIVAVAREPERAGDLATRGVAVRRGDYDRPETIAAALAGVDRLLIVSSNALGARLGQHRALLVAARTAGVGFLAYTSMLHADRSPARLLAEHRETEAMIAGCGIPAAILRNGWYNENFLLGLPAARASGQLVGAAGDGLFSAAAIADLGEAGARILAAPDPAPAVYELAGDDAVPLSAVAAEMTRHAGRSIAYVDVSVADLEAGLRAAGLPAAVAEVIADADGAAAGGAFLDRSGTLGRILGRPTTPVAATIAAAFVKG